MGKDEFDLVEMAESCGFPSFDEYCKNVEKYTGRADAALAEVDRGSTQLNRTVQKHIYEIEGFKCKTLEEVERVAESMGIKLRELDYRPQVQTNTSGGVDIKVNFVSKAERDKRNKW